MKQTFRVWIYIVLLLCTQSCDVANDPVPASGEIVFDGQSSVKLSAPNILRSARSIDFDILSVEVILSYTDAGEPFESRQVVGPTASESDAYWQLGINVPLNTPFTLSMTWFEPGAQRLDLVRITRVFNGFSTSGRVEFAYDFSSTGEFSKVDGAPDYAGFDSDGDTITNLEESLADTDPFGSVMNDIQSLVAVPVSLNLRALTDGVGVETIVLSDAGNSNRSFTATSDSLWLTLEPAAGEIPALESLELNVSYSCEELEGDFAGTIEFLSNGLVTSVPVQLSCENVVAPLLSAVPPELTLNTQTSSTTTTTLAFRNTGNTDLTYSINSSVEWLTTPGTGSVVQPGMAESVEVSAACGLSQELRSGVLTIESDGGNATVDVILDCESPATVLIVRQQSLNLNSQFGAQATSSFVVQNTGSTPLAYTVSVEDDWLAASPASGTIPPESNAVVSVNALCATGVTTRPNELTIESAGGSATLQVTQNCKEASLPILSDVSPDLLLAVQSGESIDSAINLTNSGEATLTYEVVSDSAWLLVGQSVGSIGANTTATVAIEARCNNFVGTRNAKISIDSNGGTDTVNVSLACEGAELSNVRPDSLDLSAELGQSVQRDLSFSNSGNTALNFSVVSDSNWVNVQDSEGQLQPGLTQRIAISAVCGSTETSRSATLSIDTNGGVVTVPVTQTCAAASAAVLANVTSDLTLTAQNGQDATSSISMSNTGSAVLNYEVFSDSPWLTVETAAGTIQADNSATVPVVAQCTEGGDRTGMLSITSNGGSATVAIALTCTTEPTATLSGVTASLSLTAQTGQSATSTISMSNAGNALLNYTVSSDSPWLSVGTETGSIEADGSTSVSVSARCASAAGDRNGVLSISSNGGNASVPITLTCSATPAADLSGVTTSLSLTAQTGQSASSTISMANSGNAPLNYSVSSDSPWLTVGTETGSIEADGSTSVSVAAQCANTAGNRNGVLSISSNGGNASVPVTLTCSLAPAADLSGVTPRLSLTAQTGESATSAISMSNSGNALLNYTVSSNSPWLTVGTETGSIEVDGSTSVSVAAQCANTAGNRNGVLSITSNGGNASVPVTLTCSAAPAAELSEVTPRLVLTAQSGDETKSTISMTNSGNALLTYTVSSDSSWLTVSTEPGIIAAGRSTTESVVAQCGDFTGDREGELKITSNGGDASVSVTLTCEPVPTAVLTRVTPNPLDMSAFAGESAQRDLSFSNTGTADLNYKISSDSRWLTTQSAEGTVQPNTRETVGITGACGSNQETLTGTLNITSNGGDAIVRVTLDCSVLFAPILDSVVPTLSLDQTSPKPASSEFVLSNSGDAELSYQIVSDSSWLSVDPASGLIAPNTSSQVVVVAQCTDFIGSRTGKLSITSDGGNEVIDVSLICFGPKLGDVQPQAFDLIVRGEQQVAVDVLSFANVGNVDMNYSVASDSNWLCIDVAASGACQSSDRFEGSLEPLSDTKVSIRATCPATFSDVSLSGSLTISGSGGRQVVPVKLTCGQP